GLEVALERCQLWDQRAREGRSPALLEDRQLQALDVAVGGRPAGANEAMVDVELVDRLLELPGAKLRAVVGDHGLEAPTGLGELPRHPSDERPTPPGPRVLGRRVKLGPGKA